MTPYATLGMYPLTALRPAWERLWAAVHELVPWTPPTLTWTDDVHATWTDSACVVGHACGWPVATYLRDRVDVVGAFALDLPDASGHHYRSALLASRPATLASLVTPTSVAAATTEDSLSGWISLRAAAADGREWPGPVVWTGGHVASLEALQAGRADLASVDALTLAHVRRHLPHLVAGLHVVGFGPLVPSLPIVVPRGTAPERVAALRVGLATAVADPAVGARAELRFTDFVTLGNDAYAPLLALTSEHYSRPVRNERPSDGVRERSERTR